jgi:polyphosphate kinase
VNSAGCLLITEYLQEAADIEVPLYERIKFLAIYSSNLEEFFRVRLALLKNLARLSKTKANKELEVDPFQTIEAIHKVVRAQHHEFEHIFKQSILPALAQHDIILYQGQALLEEHTREVVHFFKTKVLSYLQPILLSSKKGNKPFMENDALYFAISLRQNKKPSQADKTTIAYLNIPSGQQGRFVELSSVKGKHYYIFLEDVIRLNLKTIFPGYDVLGCYSVKMDRSSSLGIEDEYSGDLIEKIKRQLSKRASGEPTRFLYEESMPREILQSLKNTFGLYKEDLVPGGSHQNLDDLMKLPNPVSPKLEYAPLPAINKKELDARESIFESIRNKDHILHFPYHSYDYVLRFFNEAAIDPYVKEIKVTLYRIASKSLIANALISAAKNGKRVTVFVEVKARFDEANNLQWAQEMEKAGIHIIYSIPGLKVHAKIALVKRITGKGKTQGYAYLGTGNFNERTAEIYADHGLFTSHQGIVRELQQVFTHIAGKEGNTKFKHLLVAGFNLQKDFLEKIDREIRMTKKGKPARVIIKLNNLEEKVMIDKLYEASRAGVKVDLLIRGICCLVPGVQGQSENIQVIRIVDRFLEHARVFYFYNGGKEDIYLSSADWMKRNLYKRIEVGFPVYDAEIRAELKQMLYFQLQDTLKAKRLDGEQNNLPIESRDEAPVRSQITTYEWLKNKEENKQAEKNKQ